MIYVIVLIIIFGIIFFFFSSKVSPIPYFPTNKDDLQKIIDIFDMKDEQVIFDLGAGDGTVIFDAADKAHKKELQTEFVAVDINFLLVLIMHVRRLFHPHKKHIHIVQGDMFQCDYEKYIRELVGKKPKADQTIFYIYISPWFTKAVHEMISSMNVPARIISYYYPVEGSKEKKKIEAVNDIYLYDVK